MMLRARGAGCAPGHFYAAVLLCQLQDYMAACAQVSRAHALVDEACARLSEQLLQDVVAATNALHERGGLPPGPEGEHLI